jgi:uncharacterized RDD family membrane protein YckC
VTDAVLKPGERYAGFWIRFVASVVDSVIVSLIIGPIAAALYDKPGAMDAAMAALESRDLTLMTLALLDAMRPAGVGDFVLNNVVPAAGIVAFWVYRSATPGKMVTNTRIVDADSGGTPTTKQCVVRYFGYFVSIFGLFLGFIWIAFDRRKQGWHDKLARTVVVHTSQISNA